VALTENWQRLDDLAARAMVVDEKPDKQLRVLGTRNRTQIVDPSPPVLRKTVGIASLPAVKRPSPQSRTAWGS
jgi:hypothetical protein